jgi:hypothetical protein
MTDTVRDLIEVAMRLSQLRDAPPPSLHLHLRPRDGPRCPSPGPRCAERGASAGRPE